MAANLRDPGSIPGGDPKGFQYSSNYIVGECFSSAADTHLATDLTCKVSIITVILKMNMNINFVKVIGLATRN